MTRLRIFALLIACTLALPGTAAPRIALVIGNTAYPGNRIDVAERDMARIGFALRQSGFRVIEAPNVDRESFIAKLDEYRTALLASPDVETVVYYSGHGVTFDGQTWLIPIDIEREPITRESFPRNAIPLSAIHDRLRSVKLRIALIMLDACRSNLYDENGVVTEGLVEPKADTVPTRTITAFADAAGKAVSKSTDGISSAYAKAILDHIRTPGLPVSDFLAEVGTTVETQTGGEQTPIINSAQRLPFFFREPILLEVSAGEVDDDLIVAAGGDTYIRSVDGPTKRLRLWPGDNVVTVTVANFRSKSGGDLLPEGWRYSLRTRIVNGPPGPTLASAEPERPVPRERWGRSFVAARFTVNISRHSDVVRFGEVEDAIWKDGFSLLGREADALYEAVRWAVIYRGMPLLGRSEDEIRSDTIAAHELAVEEHDRVGTLNGEHSQASDIAGLASDADVREVLRRINASISRDEIAENLRVVCSGPRRQICIGFRSNDQWPEIRAFYEWTQRENVNGRHLLAVLDDNELKALYDRLF